MVTYTVHEAPDAAADRIDRGEALEFIKDGFSWVTALFPPLGFAARGLWLFALGWFVAIATLAAILKKLGADDALTGIAIFAAHIFAAFEVSSLQRWSLDQKGWRMIGSVVGSNQAECERRFFEKWVPDQPATTGIPKPKPSRFGGGAAWPYVSKT